MPKVIVVLLLVLAGCGHTATTSAPAHRAAPAPTPPIPDAPLPRSVPAMASALAGTTRQLEGHVSEWLASHPSTSTRPPAEIELEALFQQRLYRYLRLQPALAARVLGALPSRLRQQARDNLAAGRSLVRLTPKKPPKTQPRVRVAAAEPPARLLSWYRAAQRRFGVRWQVLAAVNFVETAFGRMRNLSYAGAQGPMQFIPATWRAYGLGGDIRDPHDAIMGAANYLHASGAPGNYRRAIYSYNPSPLYVDAITRYARQMQRKPERFYAYWSWQVFVRDKRLTGPGI
jgi:soluble lytic murein transglycosylase-like protein